MRPFSPLMFWLQWTLGTALILGISFALFNAWGLLVVSGIGLGFWQGWLLRRWIVLWRWWVVTIGFALVGLFLVVVLSLTLRLPESLFSLLGLLSGAVLGASLGLGQALILRQRFANAFWWIPISAVALAIGAGWVIDIALRLSFTMETPYGSVLTPLAESLLRSESTMQAVCQFPDYMPSRTALPYPLRDRTWLFQCRGVGVAIAFLSGLIGGAIKGAGMVWLLKGEERGVRS